MTSYKLYFKKYNIKKSPQEELSSRAELSSRDELSGRTAAFNESVSDGRIARGERIAPDLSGGVSGRCAASNESVSGEVRGRTNLLDEFDARIACKDRVSKNDILV